MVVAMDHGVPHRLSMVGPSPLIAQSFLQLHFFSCISGVSSFDFIHEPHFAAFLASYHHSITIKSLIPSIRPQLETLEEEEEARLSTVQGLWRQIERSSSSVFDKLFLLFFSFNTLLLI